MKIYIKITALALLMLACGPVRSDVQFPFESRGWEDSIDGSIPGYLLSLSSIEIGTTTLEEVSTQYGPAVVYRPGDESYLPSLICYLSDSDDTAVIFQSGPLGGWKVVTAIWVGYSRLIDTTKCAISSNVSHEKARIHGIFLGSSFSMIQEDLGRPTFAEPPFIAYRFQDREVLDADSVFDITSGLEMELRKDCVVWFRVYRQASN